MPELPEVETILNQITPHIIHKQIADFYVTDKGLRLLGKTEAAEFGRRIINAEITDTQRHGKFMRFVLNNSFDIFAHLRMSGRFVISSEPSTHLHNRLWMRLSDGNFLNFIDTRRFATFHLINKSDSPTYLANFGLDALDPQMTSAHLYCQFKHSKRSIYSALMDQRLIAGLGNIYVNETLFASRIHPQTVTHNLTHSDAQSILKNAKNILLMAINHKGTTLIDKTYKDIKGSYGEFAMKLQVYGRAGKACLQCRTPIERTKLGSRSVYFCPKCQRLLIKLPSNYT